MQITTKKLIEIMSDRLTGWCKTVDNKLYSLISNKELIDILNDCGVEVKHNCGWNVEKPLKQKKL